MKKRILLLLVIIFSVFVLFGLLFGPGKYEFLHKVDHWDDVKIEIIDVDGSIDSTFFTVTPFKESYNEEKISVLAVIQDKLPFIHDLEELTSYKPLGDPIGSISGTMVRLTFPDGEIELISSYGCALISGTDVDVYTKTFDKEEFNDFVLGWLNAMP